MGFLRLVQEGITMIQEIDQRHYDPSLIEPGSFVFDLGALRGKFAHSLANLGYKVIAFEPDPSGIQTITPHKNITTVQKAVGYPSGRRKFFQYLPSNGANGFYSNKYEKKINPGQVIEVDVITLEDAIKQYGTPSLMKMNIEGAEVEIIKNTPDDILSSIKQITVSFHTFCDIVTPEQVKECHNRLSSLGFELHFFAVYPDEVWAVKI